MIKAIDFWNYLCSEHNYRLFAGVPCVGLKLLYDKLSSKLLWYMPAVNLRIAMGIVSGGFLAGFKGGVLLSASSLSALKKEFQIIKDFNIPMLLIVYEDTKVTYPFWKKELTDDFKKDLDKIANRNKPSILLIKEGMLK